MAVRYNPDGSLDTSFNHTGISHPFPKARSDASCMILQTDGKIVIGGMYSYDTTSSIPVYSLELERLKNDGTSDSSYGNNGFFYWPDVTYHNGLDILDKQLDISEIIQQPDGKIVACGGYTAHDSSAVIRINANGIIDSGFGNDGITVIGPKDGIYDFSTDVRIEPDNKIVTSGTSGYGFNEDSTRFAVTRYTTNGSLDSGFGVSAAGKTLTAVKDFPSFAYSLALSGNRIYLAGESDSGLAIAAYLQNDGILPVTLLSFTAQKQDKNVLLQWQTANEINNSYFGIERSANGGLFTGIGQVAALKTSAVNNYSFTDNAPLQGNNYYRLKQVDKDGKFTYSNIVTVNFAAGVFSAAPNPASNIINLTVPQSSNATTIILYDAEGRSVLSQQLSPNITTKQIDVSTLAAGVYTIILNQNGNRQTVKVVKK